jgi:hypothetical protein
MKDLVVVALLITAFAFLVTMHVVITVALGQRAPRWRALAGFVVPPLAPYWAWREHMRKRAVFWIAAALVYGVMLLLATRG